MEKELDRLLRGTATGDVATIRDAWRALLANPHDATPLVRARLSSPIWTDEPRGPAPRYFGVLLALLDELDRAAFADEVAHLGRRKLHPVHARTLEIVARRLTDEPAFHIGAVPVYISPEATAPEWRVRALQRWGRTQGLGLDEINADRRDRAVARDGLRGLRPATVFGRRAGLER